MKNGIERRRNLRVPLALHVVLMTLQGPMKGKTADISVSGLAVILFLEKPEICDEFEITLKSSEGHEMSMTCDKVWSSKFISNETVYNAFGVQFTKISASDRKIIAAMVKEYYLV
ncbi:MAG: PilZ domain-containing protein [Thermodesulfobacteriota bacterium]